MTARLARRILVPLLAFGVLIPSGIAQQKAAQAGDDIVLGAMRAELDRSKAQLKMDQVASPYYVEYRIFDVDQYSADAAFGALRFDVRTRFRFVRVAVRIGDYKQDSYFGHGEGNVDIMPLDNDMLALRHQLWLATDRAYKAAAESLTAKQAQLKQLNVDQPVDDFAHADPVQSIGPVAVLDFDPGPWKRMLQDASALYKSDPDIETFESRLNFQAVNRYLVNSEGTVVRNGQSLYEMAIAATTQAADGMSLARDNAFNVRSMKELPSAADFVSRATTLASSLKELREAPVTEEEYRGPVLLSSDAAAGAMSELVGPNLLGNRCCSRRMRQQRFLPIWWERMSWAINRNWGRTRARQEPLRPAIRPACCLISFLWSMIRRSLPLAGRLCSGTIRLTMRAFPHNAFR